MFVFALRGSSLLRYEGVIRVLQLIEVFDFFGQRTHSDWLVIIVVLMARHVSIASKRLNYIRFPIMVYDYRLRDIALSRDAIVRGFNDSLSTVGILRVWNQLCVRSKITRLAPMSRS